MFRATGLKASGCRTFGAIRLQNDHMTIVGDTDLLRRTEEAMPTGFTWPPPPPAQDADILWLEPESPAAPTANVPARVPNAEGATGVPVSYLLLPGVSFDFEWQDVVALVQELGAQLKDAKPTGSLLALDAITLEPDGRLGVKLDTGTVPLVRSLGQVLQQLLIDQPSPANLRLIALQANSETSTFASVEDLRSGWKSLSDPAVAKPSQRCTSAHARPCRRSPYCPYCPHPRNSSVTLRHPRPQSSLSLSNEQVNGAPPARGWQTAGLVAGTLVVVGTAAAFMIRGRSEPVSAPQAAVDRLLQAVPDDVPEPPSSNGVAEQEPSPRSSPAKSAVRAADSPVRLARPASPPAADATAARASGLAAEAVTPGRQPAVSGFPETPKRSSGAHRHFSTTKNMQPQPQDFSESLLLSSNEEPSASSLTLRSTADDGGSQSRRSFVDGRHPGVYNAGQGV